jgi:flavin-dependent dehydrogenase
VASTCDVLVVGGGPAGVGLAVLLARGGVHTVLATRTEIRASGPFETMLPAARTLLARIGLDDLVASCAEPDPLRHGARWGNEQLQWREPEPGGLLLRRGPFDVLLRRAAAAAGVVVRDRVQVHDGERSVGLVSAHGLEQWRPRCLVHATGRGGGRQALGPRTTAYTFVGEPAPEDRGTAVVESVADGWSWTHAPREGPAACAWFLDATLDGPARRAALARAFAAVQGPARRLRGARLAFANDATPTIANASPGHLAIGDAAATADPLSSQGVEKAFAAADHAAAVVRTLLAAPDWTQRLHDTHRRWELGLAHAHAQAAQAWYLREQRFASAPFWVARRPDATMAGAVAPTEALVAAPNLRCAEILVREGDRFVPCQGVRDTTTGDERSHVGYVPIAPLLEVFAIPLRLGNAVVAAGRDPRLYVLPPRAVHAAMLELVRLGWLLPAGEQGDR